MRRKKNNDFTLSKMYCCKCGHEGINIPRKTNSYREAGHLKKLYCIFCKQEWNHAEVRNIYSNYNYNDFLLEMEYNNFDEEGNRKEPYKIFKENLRQKGLI